MCVSITVSIKYEKRAYVFLRNSKRDADDVDEIALDDTQIGQLLAILNKKGHAVNSMSLWMHRRTWRDSRSRSRGWMSWWVL